MDNISTVRLSLVAPELRRLATSMLDQLESEGIPCRVTRALCTYAEQAALYAQGRTAPGHIVTYAPPGYSDHEFGMAIDVVPMTLPHGQPDWNDTHPAWQRIVEIGESVGLIAGKRFKHHPDEPHFQLTGIFPATPNDAERQLLTYSGLIAVWKAADIFDPPATETETEEAVVITSPHLVKKET